MKKNLKSKKMEALVAISANKSSWDSFRQARGEVDHSQKKKVFVATYTNEGLSFQIVLGPLKFERSKRGGDYTSRKTTVATI